MGNLLDLQQPLLDGGITSVNFFNGRLLTGTDLSREQDARRTSDWRVAQAIGEGVAFGLGVVEDSDAEGRQNPRCAVVRVSPGLAINRQGQVLRLECAAQVRLVRPVQGAVDTARIFGACEPANGSARFAGAGLYVLAIAPAEGDKGRAPTNGLDPQNVRCNTDATVEGVQFRLLPVKANLYPGIGPGSATFRNALAYRCFGSDERAAWLADPFGADLQGYGLMDALRGSVLTDCDVPLALVFMVGAATISFIDLWSVRRTPHVAREISPWTTLVSPRRAAEGQAMFLQFQEQVAALRSKATGDLGDATATKTFSFLPPVGIVPLSAAGSVSDQEATNFFSGLTTRGPAFINGARLDALLRDGCLYPPVDTTSGELVWLYRVRENAMASGAGCLVFASGHIPYAANAQFDLAHWNYANFALR